MTAPWWRSAVFYQVYPRSFQDTGGDGIGDLDGVARRLPYLRWLGVDGLWVTPITDSADDDLGYDVTDYLDVHPALGGLPAADRLLAGAEHQGVRVLLDVVPNHTSDRHRWFRDARTSRTAAQRDWYVWADPAPGGGPPNNWASVFGGPAWELEPATGQYYLHQFLPSQPDLNWWSPAVRDEFDRILRFWFDRGAAGFRIDTVNRVVKDLELRDNPPVEPSDSAIARRLGQRPVWTTSRPEVHEVWRRWRAICRQYAPERLLVGETWLFELDDLARYYGDGDELHLNFNFPFLHAPFEAAALRDVVERTEAALGAERWPAWTAGNHDVTRFPTRWCGGDAARTRMALVMLLTLRGTPFLYYGDELGMADVEVPAERAVDPLFHRFPGQRRSRDGARTPMRWRPGPGAGFTHPGVEPWLPLDPAGADVATQRADRTSTLHLCRELIRLRRRTPDLQEGAYRSVDAPDGVWAYRRGEHTLVALNFGAAEAAVRGVRGSVALSSDRRREDRPAPGELRLAPGEGAVLALE
ncbi:MAG TPA: alpha-amylase family glycosyl hydrolase [Candidatus Dormibacteraeota bacterium]|nr:alpha-amylase family glycosyl hydrolase [Candidatus Dormibacteraeota bacterium]